MAAERLSSSFVKLNLSAIKKSDQFVVNIVDTASQVALYKFNGETQAWEKTDVEGALFVYSRSTSPTSAFFIMNRLNMKNMMEPITSNMEFKLQDPFLLYRNLTKGIFGIWFYVSEECKRLATLMNKLSSQTMMMGNSVESNPPAADIPQASQEAKTEEKVDIMQLFAKAQERYNKQTKTSSSAALASPMASPQNQQQISQEQREQHQRFLQENQLQKEQLQRLFKNEDTRPRKQRAYSSPTPNLPGQTPKTPKGDGLQNGVLPRAEGNSSRKTEKMKSLTLSDVKAPISSGESKQIMTTQDDSVIDTSKPGAQRKLFQNERAEPKSAGTIPMPSAAPQSTGVSQVKESPQKSLPDQGSMAGASLMSPLAFQSSGKVTILTSPAQPKQPPKMEIAPLTEEQLVQALTYLLKNDAEFVTKIHEAYFKSLQDKLPT